MDRMDETFEYALQELQFVLEELQELHEELRLEVYDDGEHHQRLIERLQELQRRCP